ncbi:hypothetical protein C8R44DRAFT_873184 [Mycena epipterygia]|nr:hypothetical protein C8R44DRAFT_873184 [Mycena epipterygia]
MPFVMLLFVDLDKMFIIISPLNTSEVDQASCCKKMGLSAVTVNGDTYSNEIHKERHFFILLIQLTITAILGDLSVQAPRHYYLPEHVPKTRQIPTTTEHPGYAQLGTLRTSVLLKVPFLIASATLPLAVLAEVRKSVHMNADTSCFVHHMKVAKPDLEALEFLIPPHDSEDAVINLTQSMVFFDDINIPMDALKHLQELVSENEGEIAKFRTGEIKILLTQSPPDWAVILHTMVLLLVPSSLSSWMQHAGRAGRNFLMAVCAILLVEPSVFQKVNPQNRRCQLYQWLCFMELTSIWY